MPLTPETLNEISKLASEMSNQFSPPILIPGCEVMSVADIDEYDTNNGWIEAICGKHNQQRCRWVSSVAVTVGDYVDVLYFKSIRLFRVLGFGGTGAAPAANLFGFKVKNTSGVTTTLGDVGYIDEAGEYKETTTAYSNVAWCVVLVGGANNTDIYVARRGRVTVTLNGNCSAGDYLYTSTTAGQAQPQSYTRQELFAVALTANTGGAGGTCRALLLTQTKFVVATSTNFILRVANSSSSSFAALIDDNAPAHGGQGLDATHVPFDTVTLGNKNVVNPAAATELGKMVLHNTTRGTSRLVTSLDAANDWIGTVASADAWANNDSITIESQTVTRPGATKQIDVELSQQTEVPLLARSIACIIFKADSGSVQTSYLHPFEAYGVTKLFTVLNFNVANVSSSLFPINLVSQTFTVAWDASGVGTTTTSYALAGYYVAEP